MHPRHQALDDSLALRHAMGCKRHDAHRLLSQFVDFLHGHGATCIPTAWAVGWAIPPGHVQPAEWARRLRLVRGFAQYQGAHEPRTQVPSPHLWPYRPQRHTPSLYSEAESAPLIAAASRLPSATGRRACTSVTMFALLVATGMRIRALLALDRDAVDLQDGLLTSRPTPLRTSRCRPLPPTTQQALCRYGHQRDHVYPIPKSPSVFVSETGLRLTPWAVRATFIQLARQIG
jgi:integrase/recombinase XerD